MSSPSAGGDDGGVADSGAAPSGSSPAGFKLRSSKVVDLGETNNQGTSSSSKTIATKPYQSAFPTAFNGEHLSWVQHHHELDSNGKAANLEDMIRCRPKL